MRYGCVCSGIGAATAAWKPLGWKAEFFSEIEPFPSAVLAHHYPETPNFGDLNNHRSWNHAALDLLVGGTPCQSFSVAGLRKGMDDPRGQLVFAYLSLARASRARWLVWENVPGVLSVDQGRAFGALLGALAELGYGFAYRVLDAQHFGVPQRRRRVILVGYLGDWRPAAAVLFERHCLQGYPAPRRKARKDIAPTISARTKGCGGLGTDFDCDGGLIPKISPAIKARDYKGPSSDGDGDGAPLIVHSLRAEGFDASEDGTGRGTPIIPIAIQAGAIKENPDIGPDGIGVRQDGVAYTLEARQEVQAVAFSCKDHGADAANIAPTLRAMGHDGSHANAGGQVAVAFDSKDLTLGTKHTTSTLTTNGDDNHAGGRQAVCMQTMQVRRLTPKECCRLQGFPDDYLDILYRGKKAADGPKYKALGNSMAVPVMVWIGRRIQMVEEIIRKEVAA